jgi:hypothetical protein
MTKSSLLAIGLIAMFSKPDLSLAEDLANTSRELGLSVSQLLRSPTVYRDPITVHAEVIQGEHGRWLADEHCRRHCDYVIGYDIDDKTSRHPGVEELGNATVDNDHKCFMTLKVRVIYKSPPRPDVSRSLVVVRPSHLNVIKVLAVECRAAPNGR